MEKMIWTRPMAEVEQFMPNEYIAACGDITTHYKFKCTSGDGFIKIFGIELGDAWGDVYTAGGVNLTPGIGSYYHPCGKEHASEKSDEYINGYFVLNAGTDIRGLSKEIPVVIWTDGGKNVHCTANTNIDSWEETKS